MAFDAHRNFAVSLVAAAPSPAASGTTLTVTAAQGARFPSVAPFPVVVCPAAAQPTPDNAEIATCTARAGDVLTLTRAAEGTTARTILVGDQVWAGPTVKTFTDIETQVAALDPPGSAAAAQSAAAADATAKVAAEAAARAAAITGQHTADVALFDAAGAATAAQTAAAADATGKVATETTRATTAEGLAAAKASNLSDLASAATARTNLGLGTAATTAATAYDTAGAATTAQTYAVQRANHTGTQLMATVSDAGGAATRNVGTTAGTVAAGDDTRITGAATAASVTAEAATARAAESAAQSTANGAAVKANNLSDLASASTARTNLGLGTASVVNTGTGAGNAVLGNDARLSDARTPTAHASTHAPAGTDDLTTALSATSAPVALGTAATGSGTGFARQGHVHPTTGLALSGAAPTAHAASHASGGSDPVTLAESQVTNLTADLAAKVPLSTVTAAADLIVGTGTAAVTRLGKGTALQTLRVNAAATALEYATPAAAKSAATRAYTRQNWR